MNVEIVSTGSELLLGQNLNTTGPFLAERLNELGFHTLYMSTVGDNRLRMRSVIETALSRADIIFVTGGLGPTLGDISKEVTSEIVSQPLVLHMPSLEKIKTFFINRQIPMPENNIRQAMMPQPCIVLENSRGTAPGVIIETNKNVIIHLPGPPTELENMFETSVVPYLMKRYGVQGTIFSRTLRTCGISESLLEEKIRDFLLSQSNPTLALLAKNNEIWIRITMKALSRNEAENSIRQIESQLRQRLSQYIFGTDQESLEEVIGNILTKQHATLSVAESCTGGLVSSRITDTPGSSSYLIGSLICYSNQIKQEFLDIPDSVLREFGAVSQETAQQMAQGIRKHFKTDLGLAITGIAGPTGNSSEKPIGLVFISVDGPKGLVCHKHYFSGTRTMIKNRTALYALYALYLYCQKSS